MSIAWCILHVMISKSTSSQKTNTQTSEARQRYPSHMPNLENLQSKHGKDTKKTSNIFYIKDTFNTFTFRSSPSSPLLSEHQTSFHLVSSPLSTCQVAGVQHCHAIAPLPPSLDKSLDPTFTKGVSAVSASRILFLNLQLCSFT